MKYFITNWKTNKNIVEAKEWIEIFIKKYTNKNNVKIIICPSYPFIYFLKEKTVHLKNVFIASQDLSVYEEGSYTGEVTAKNLKGLVNFSIIGHSERRKNFNDTDEVLFKKIALARKYGIEPIYCIRDESDPIPDDVKIIAYEPIYAIGTGMNEPADKVIEMKKKLKIDQNKVFIYGGSVNEKNAIDYLKIDGINGFLVGKVSLDPEKFAALINLV